MVYVWHLIAFDLISLAQTSSFIAICFAIFALMMTFVSWCMNVLVSAFEMTRTASRYNTMPMCSRCASTSSNCQCLHENSRNHLKRCVWIQSSFGWWINIGEDHKNIIESTNTHANAQSIKSTKYETIHFIPIETIHNVKHDLPLFVNTRSLNALCTLGFYLITLNISDSHSRISTTYRLLPLHKLS